MLSKKHPALYRAAVFFHRAKRWSSWFFGPTLATDRAERLPVRIASHQSPLLRKLGDIDMDLQKNKAVNLKIAADRINGTVIRPGETFSLWKLVGKPTAKRGFRTGLLISRGKPTSGIGGGLCQMANLLYWMFLHAPLEITERHHHSIDLFPDSGRTIPFGTGATIFYNYVDLRVKNTTEQDFQILVHVDGKYLRGSIQSSKDTPHRYSIIEKEHAFLKDAAGVYWRTNKIFRQIRETETGRVLNEEHLMTNLSRVAYIPDPELVREAEERTTPIPVIA